MNSTKAVIGHGTGNTISFCPELDERRADIIPMGSLILSESLEILDYNTLRVTTRGLRYGALHVARDTAMKVQR